MSSSRLGRRSQSPALPQTCCVTPGTSLYLSVPQSGDQYMAPPLQNALDESCLVRGTGLLFMDMKFDALTGDQQMKHWGGYPLALVALLPSLGLPDSPL